MLKSDRDTNAFSASRMFSSLTVTYTANVVKATWKHIKKQLTGNSDTQQYDPKKNKTRSINWPMLGTHYTI